MILNDRLIREYCIQQNMIEPFDEQRVNPASYDLTLYGKIIEITPGGIMDASNTGNAAHRLTSQRTLQLNYGQSYLLQPGVFILASSVEYVRLPPELAGEVKLKSTTARKGIGHVYSGWIDPGFEGQITFELFSHVPVLLEPGKPICQIIFSEMAEIPEQPYKGRYQHQQGPTPARQMEFPGLDLLVKSGYEDAKGNPIPPIGDVPSNPEVVASIIEAIREDFGPQPPVNFPIIDNWQNKPRPKVDRDWSEEEV